MGSVLGSPAPPPPPRQPHLPPPHARPLPPPHRPCAREPPARPRPLQGVAPAGHMDIRMKWARGPSDVWASHGLTVWPIIPPHHLLRGSRARQFPAQVLRARPHRGRRCVPLTNASVRSGGCRESVRPWNRTVRLFSLVVRQGRAPGPGALLLHEPLSQPPPPLPWAGQLSHSHAVKIIFPGC